MLTNETERERERGIVSFEKSNGCDNLEQLSSTFTFWNLALISGKKKNNKTKQTKEIISIVLFPYKDNDLSLSTLAQQKKKSFDSYN